MNVQVDVDMISTLMMMDSVVIVMTPVCMAAAMLNHAWIATQIVPHAAVVATHSVPVVTKEPNLTTHLPPQEALALVVIHMKVRPSIAPSS